MALRTTATTAWYSRQWKGILWMSSRQQSNWNGFPGSGGDGSAQSGSSSAGGAPELNPMPGRATGGVGGFSAGVPPLPPVPPTTQGGFAPPQGGFAPPQGGFAAPQGGFAALQGGFAAPRGGFAAPQGGYAPPQHGFVTSQGYAAQQGGFAPGSSSTFNPRPSRRPTTATPVPNKEPFGLMIFGKTSQSNSEVLDLFADQNPVSVESNQQFTHILFSNRADLVAALARSGTKDVNYIRLEPSAYLQALGEIGDRGPFRVQVRGLPESMMKVELSQFLSDSYSCTVLDCVVLTHQHNGTKYAFVEVATKAEMMRLLERLGKEEMNGMTATPAYPRPR